jgi:hypothetical protein
MLQTEQRTVEMGARVSDAAQMVLGLKVEELQVDFEHGQWWVTNRPTGAQWSAVDADGPETWDGFGFEQVPEGGVSA